MGELRGICLFAIRQYSVQRSDWSCRSGDNLNSKVAPAKVKNVHVPRDTIPWSSAQHFNALGTKSLFDEGCLE